MRQVLPRKTVQKFEAAEMILDPWNQHFVHYVLAHLHHKRGMRNSSGNAFVYGQNLKRNTAVWRKTAYASSPAENSTKPNNEGQVTA